MERLKELKCLKVRSAGFFQFKKVARITSTGFTSPPLRPIFSKDSSISVVDIVVKKMERVGLFQLYSLPNLVIKVLATVISSLWWLKANQLMVIKLTK